MTLAKLLIGYHYIKVEKLYLKKLLDHQVLPLSR
jgi:hypothetical protein